jgi:hypothetical protein
MIEITFSVPRPHGGDVEWEVVATLYVEGTRFNLERDESFAEVRDIEVLDLDSGQTVNFDADPERWARSLPQAFRSGDLVCRVTGASTADVTAGHAIAAGA